MKHIKEILGSVAIAVFVLSFWVFLCVKLMVILGIVKHHVQFDSLELVSFVIMLVSLLLSVRTFVVHTKIANEKNIEKSNNLELRLQAIDATNVVVEFNPDGTIISVNNKFKELLGYGDCIIGKHHSVLVPDNVKNSMGYKRFWSDLSKGIKKNGEFHRLSKNGDDVYIIGNYIPLKNKNGDVWKVFKIAQDNTEKYKALEQVSSKNVYLEHAAKILRHDMHSGINTYIPRGLKSLLRRLDEKKIDELRIGTSIKMISEGLKHTQQVYSGVFEFTNLVKDGSKLQVIECNVGDILKEYLKRTSYYNMVKIDNLPTLQVNQSLFCTAIDNLIRNGLKYNDSKTKYVKIYNESIKNSDGTQSSYIIIEDNGRGMTQKDFENYCKPYVRKEGQKESGSGLGLNICSLILKEHNFHITAEKMTVGTKLRIKYD
jgi:PAS domain S-box-containing protein